MWSVRSLSSLLALQAGVTGVRESGLRVGPKIPKRSDTYEYETAYREN